MKKEIRITKSQGTPRSGYRYDFLDGFIMTGDNSIGIGYKGTNGQLYGLTVSLCDVLDVLKEKNGGISSSSDNRNDLNKTLTKDSIHENGGCYCKECSKYYRYEDWNRYRLESLEAHECRLFRVDFGPDGFCCCGEKRED